MKNLLKRSFGIIDIFLSKLNYLLEGIVYARNYRLDWNHVLRTKKQQGIEDILEFATYYTFYWHDKNRKMNDSKSKKRMHCDLMQGLMIREES